MAQFEQQIKQDVEQLNSYGDYGWTTYIQSSPARKIWNTLPCVLICPVGQSFVKYHAFGYRNMVSNYDIFLVSANDMINVQSTQHSDFLNGLTDILMPMSDNIATAGAWQTRIDQSYEFDRKAFPEAYSVSCLKLSVYWISPNTH